MTTSGNAPVLICYDNSDGARRAIATAGELFHGRSALVLHVWSPIAIIAAAYGGVVALPAYDDTALRAAAAKVAEEGAALAGEAGLDATPLVAEATYEGTAHVILDAVAEQGAGVVVLGARGLSGFRSFVLGSVSHAVAQHAHVPVLIVPPPVHAEAEAADAATAIATA